MCRLRRSDTILSSHDLEKGVTGGHVEKGGAQGEGVSMGRKKAVVLDVPCEVRRQGSINKESADADDTESVPLQLYQAASLKAILSREIL